MRACPLPPLLSIVLALPLLTACAEEGGSADSDPSATGLPTGTAEEGDAEPQAATLPMAETGWLTIGRDGSVQTTYFDPDGRYRDVRGGAPFGEGRWEQRADGRICFRPEPLEPPPQEGERQTGDEAGGDGAGEAPAAPAPAIPEECWKTSAPEADGSVIATNDDDRRVELQRVTYIAPVADDDG
ncbi:hypothetical protein [Erythrobacter sp.]|jgi:hypothetical protein|uniref:hypothetical protein n=1 Tax=Erythrobacter sp. TaxID=1042 RepID=UPI002EA55670|nr:hypothetical protein [Erythrobacter sp.]